MNVGPETPSLEEQLREIVRKNSRLDITSIRDDDALSRDLGFDSLSFLTTLGDLEDVFGVEIPVERIEEFSGMTFGELVTRVRRHLGAG